MPCPSLTSNVFCSSPFSSSIMRPSVRTPSQSINNNLMALARPARSSVSGFGFRVSSSTIWEDTAAHCLLLTAYYLSHFEEFDCAQLPIRTDSSQNKYCCARMLCAQLFRVQLNVSRNVTHIELFRAQDTCLPGFRLRPD